MNEVASTPIIERIQFYVKYRTSPNALTTIPIKITRSSI